VKRVGFVDCFLPAKGTQSDQHHRPALATHVDPDAFAAAVSADQDQLWHELGDRAPAVQPDQLIGRTQGQEAPAEVSFESVIGAQPAGVVLGKPDGQLPLCDADRILSFGHDSSMPQSVAPHVELAWCT